MTLTVGSRVGQFEIVEAIGSGGMGEVFRAHDRNLGRDVAIKVLPHEFSDDPERRQRLGREARLLAALNHPHIAQVYGIEEHPTGSAIVMELVPGSTLRDHLRTTGVGMREAVAIARQIALALDAAHEKGIIHRDLKPANIKVTPEGIVKVLDFGIAKLSTDERDPQDPQTTIAEATREGSVVGTIGYMSPEQARGLPVDRRTDIWAFGCVLFELCAGRPPFDRKTASDTIAAVLEGQPDWQALPAAVPARLRHLIRRCLEKDRRERLRDIGDALPELTGQPSDTEAAGPTASARWWRVAAVALAVAAAGSAATAVWLWARGRGDGPVAAVERPFRFAVAPPTGTRFGSMLASIEATTLAISPDGTRLAFIATAAGTPPQIWIRPLDEAQGKPVPGTEGASSVFWSYDGRSLGFFAAGKLRRIGEAGGASVPICDVQVGIGLSGTWGADGEILFASVQGEGIFRASSSGGAPVLVIPPTPSRRRALWPHFLPDGRRFVYTAMGGNLDGEVVLVEPGEPGRALVPALSLARFVAPDLLLTVRESTLIAQRVDLAAARAVGEPVSVVGNVSYSVATGWANITTSPNGTLVLQHPGDVSRVTTVLRSGRPETQIGPPGQYLAVRLSSDESTLLFSRLRPELGTYDIWSTTLTPRQLETPITSAPGMETGEVWMPGMRSILLAAAQGGPPNIYLRDLGSGRERRLLESPRFQYATDVSPDGKIFAYQQRTERGNWDLLQASIEKPDSPSPIVVTPSSEAGLRFAPRGDYAAYVSDESGRSEIWMTPFPVGGTRVRVSSAGGFQPRWRRDGRELYFLSPAGQLMLVPVDADGRTGAPAPLFDARGWSDFDVMDNGTRFVALIREVVGAEQPLTVLVNWGQVIGRPGH